MMLVEVYRSKPNSFQAPGGYWFLRIINPDTGMREDVPITVNKAESLKKIGVPEGAAL
jgi:hypothetical protein